jgi:hypothetical protein
MRETEDQGERVVITICTADVAASQGAATPRVAYPGNSEATAAPRYRVRTGLSGSSIRHRAAHCRNKPLLRTQFMPFDFVRGSLIGRRLSGGESGKGRAVEAIPTAYGIAGRHREDRTDKGQ